ncbi:hypothetical protein DWB77_07528 [Streptomyces hundungensis]|uniref:Uncharacterized protein n=1 Tax=Streptomyces hundungensis TaxID=1077946 RepID=A0A387HQC3_9ACTN|nr:hypothetical protein [Streptomyces hundungensis]AYG85311.1 hypothetical protein DWB77_07528 [Streptomyces hundungensis]
MLRRFIRRCMQQILEERRAARPDAARTEELTAAVKTAKADEKALLADPGQASRITALYAVRFSELEAE